MASRLTSPVLHLFRDAIRLSAHVLVGSAPTGKQLTGRLLGLTTTTSGLFEAGSRKAPRPSLCPRRSTLTPRWVLDSYTRMSTAFGDRGRHHADGRRAFSASSDNALRVWRSGERPSLRTLEGPQALGGRSPSRRRTPCGLASGQKRCGLGLRNRQSSARSRGHSSYVPGSPSRRTDAVRPRRP